MCVSNWGKVHCSSSWNCVFIMTSVLLNSKISNLFQMEVFSWDRSNFYHIKICTKCLNKIVSVHVFVMTQGVDRRQRPLLLCENQWDWILKVFSGALAPHVNTVLCHKCIFYTRIHANTLPITSQALPRPLLYTDMSLPDLALACIYIYMYIFIVLSHLCHCLHNKLPSDFLYCI